MSIVDVELLIVFPLSSGVLAFMSQEADGSGDFLLLSIEKMIPTLRFDLGSGLTILRYEFRFLLSDS